MELQVIRHKTAEDFFKSFCSEEESAPYSYQLQRMFESGAAKEGDYFVVRDGDVPVLRVEIFRNNTRRIWETDPLLSPLRTNDEDSISRALKYIFDFLDDEIFYSAQNAQLEIVIEESSLFSKIMTKLCGEYGYSQFEKLCQYQIKPSTEIRRKYAGNPQFRNITDFDPEFRFGLVSSNDPVHEIFESASPESVYQDYLDDSYESESSWKVIMKGNKASGFFLPSFTSGLKTNLRISSYFVEKGTDKDLLSDIIFEAELLAYQNEAGTIEFPVRESDTVFIDTIRSRGGNLKKILRRYAKK
jgi:hypothetical protein